MISLCNIPQIKLRAGEMTILLLSGPAVLSEMTEEIPCSFLPFCINSLNIAVILLDKTDPQWRILGTS